ncbi:MAG: class III cytochrome C family protein [Gammaproteobacteria bacterium]|nr:class III cytochrome C family protein [Gammaproteobacteria bacterium]
MAMKKSPLFVIVALNLIGLMLLVFFQPHLMISPGQPMAAHAALTTDCFACHTPFLGSAPEKCIACHRVEKIGIETTDGGPIAKEQKSVAFHQELTEQDCLACHSEHKGVQAFRPIGRFSHALLQPASREQCASCHTKPMDNLHRKIGDNCTQCHTQEAWQPATFDHDRHFRFDRHHPAECDSCHIDSDYSRYTCYGCHEHSRAKVREEHWEEGIRDYENCTECHRSGDEDEAKYGWRNRQSGAEGGYRYNREEGHGEHEEHGERDHD